MWDSIIYLLLCVPACLSLFLSPILNRDNSSITWDPMKVLDTLHLFISSMKQVCDKVNIAFLP